MDLINKTQWENKLYKKEVKMMFSKLELSRFIKLERLHVHTTNPLFIV